MVSALVKSKDQQLAEQVDRIEDLEAKLEELTRYVQMSKIDPDDPMGKDKTEEHRKKVLEQIAAADEVTEMSDSDSSDAEMQAIR